MEGETFGRVLYLVLLLAALGGWVLVEYRQRLGFALRTAMAWGMIFVGVAAGYGLWGDIRRDIRPSQTVGQDEVTIPRAQDGHYYLKLVINGAPLEMMADTGASGLTLSANDARSVGIDPAGLAYVGQAMTANGVVRTARVKLDSVDFGPFQDQGVGAFVTEGDMDISLLGMDYLGKFSIQIEGDRMVLRR